MNLLADGKTHLRALFETKFFRYSMVSVVAVAVTQIVLIAGALSGLSWTIANIIAVSAGSIPAYMLNRMWVWAKEGKSSLWGEVMPFWGMSLLGLALSIVFVGYAEKRWDSELVLSAANLAAFGLLWVAKFGVLHFVLFKNDEDGSSADDGPSVNVC